MRLAPKEIEKQSLDWREVDASATYASGAAPNTQDKIVCQNGSTSDVVVLDDLVIPRASALTEEDSRLIKALEAVLEARRTDSSVKTMSVQISDELEWS